MSIPNTVDTENSGPADQIVEISTEHGYSRYADEEPNGFMLGCNEKERGRYFMNLLPLRSQNK